MRRKSLGRGHGEIEQDQVEVVFAFQQRVQVVERADLHDLRGRKLAGHGFAQRATEQG